MIRPICFDLSHLTARTTWPLADGITNVDLAYGRHFLRTAPDAMVRQGHRHPVRVAPWYAERVIRLADRLISPVEATAEDPAFLALKHAIAEGTTVRAKASTRWGRHARLVASGAARYLALKLREAATSRRDALPENAVYLSVAQFRFEHDRIFRWLDDRRDVRAAFLIHDLLPLDYPEFFLEMEARAFVRRMDMALARAHAFIVTSEAVRGRLNAELARRSLAARPVLVAPLPSPLERAGRDPARDEILAATPYFVMIGTIEPRKNHLLLLALWRQMAERAEAGGPPPPKLVLVGRNGWKNAQIRNELDRGRLIRPHVIEAPHLSQRDLSRLVAHARAVLMPSFTEGYGLPLVEALTLGTPVVATDAPVFREVTQGRALYRGALDGPNWLATIDALTDPASEASRQAGAEASRFVPPTWSRYFDDVSQFLQSL